MSRFHPLLWLLVLLSVVAPAPAQPLFRVFPSEESTVEGGQVSVLLIQADGELFSVQIPKGYGTQVHSESQSIVFTSETGTSAIIMRATTNYAGTLPKMEDLRDTVAKKYPGASLVQSSSCLSGCGSGLCFDLFQPAQNDLMLRVRDAYFAYPEGSFEIIFSCNGADYDKSRLGFAWLLNSFHSQPEPVKTGS